MDSDKITSDSQDLKRYFVEILEWGFEDTGLFDVLADQDRFLPHGMIEYLVDGVMLRFMQPGSLSFQGNDNKFLNYGFEIMNYVNETPVLAEKIRASIHGGAFCIFMAGFYPENLERRGLKSSVYEDIASAFYGNAFGFQMVRDTSPNELFAVISHNTPLVTKSMYAARSSSGNFIDWEEDFLELFQ